MNDTPDMNNLYFYPRDKFFALKATDDSMINVGIPAGATVIVRKQDDAKSDDIVVIVENGNKALLRKYTVCKNCYILSPANGNYVPTIFSQEQNPNIIGVVVEVRYKLEVANG